MEPTLLLSLIVGITLISYVSSQFLELINLRSQRNDVPAEVAAFYDAEKYRKSQEYHREQTKFGFISSAFSLSLSLLMLLFGGFGMLDALLRIYIHNEILLALAFFGSLALASDILTLPLQWHSTFVIEEKYGFNRTTVKTFFTDKIKGYLLAATLGGGLVALLVYLITSLGPVFWLWFGVLASLLILFVNMFYTSLFLPLFNKLTPLPDGALKAAIEQFAGKVNFPLDKVFVMDGSKRSKKSNAFFSGILRKKKIVLYDTLIANHTQEELVAVLAHEVGHYKKNHIVWGFAISVIHVFFMLFVASLMVFNPNLSLALGGSQLAVHLNLIAFGILFAPISAVTGLLMTMYSRKNEFEADDYAKSTYDGKALSDALKKLSVDNLSNLYPHPLYVFFHYSHPPLLKRLEAIKNGSKVVEE